MKKKLVIAVDIDDVIVETSELVVDYYNATYGTNVELKDMYSDDVRAWGVPDEAHAIARVEKYLQTDEYRNVPPLAEAVEVIRRLAERHELHVVTGRSTIIETATKDLLRKYFPAVFQSIVFTNLYNQKVRTKAEVCREIGADLLIEDHLGHALPVAEAGITVLLFGNYPWNRADSLLANMHRVKDWAVVEEYIDAKS